MTSSSRDIILEALRQGRTVSGQKLADQAGITRTAVWKHIRSLRQEGYGIDSSSGSGYCLRSLPDGLTAREIQIGLDGWRFGQHIVCLAEVDSTQRVAAELAREGCPEGAVVLAEHQSTGRGRIQRRWHSPPGSLAISVVLRPSLPPGQAGVIPLLAGVACSAAIAELTGLHPGLKWPNDVLIGSRKVCGILAEMHGELDRIEHLIVGLGINVNTPAEAFPPDIRDTATSLGLACGHRVSAVRLVQNLLIRLEEACLDLERQGTDKLLQRWRQASLTLGRRVIVHQPAGDIQGTARDLDIQGGLIVDTDSGPLTVHSGDVSLREGV